MVKSSTGSQKVVTTGTKSTKRLKKTNASTQEQIQNENLTNNSKSLENPIPIIKPTVISDLDMILTEKDSEPFWNSYSLDLSKKLWLPPMIPSSESRKTLLSTGYSDILEPSIPSYKISNPNKPKHPIITLKSKKNKIKLKDIVITRKIRFYPSDKQRQFLEECFGTHRSYYNKGVQYMKDNPTFKLTHASLRKQILPPTKTLKGKEKEIAERTPYCIKDGAIGVFTTMYKSANTNKARKNIKHFEMKFLEKRSRSQVCYIDKDMLTPDGLIFRKWLKKDARLKFRPRMRRWLDKNMKEIQSDFQIIKDEAGRYYLCLPITIQQKVEPIKKRMVALDPGKRTFQTFYSEDECGKLGDDLITRIDIWNERLDHLESIKHTVNARTRNKINRRCRILRAKIRNIMTDAHKKIAKFLVDNYSVILLPRFDIKGMVTGSKFHKLNRGLYNLAHYKFKQILLHKANTICNRNVIICDEHYTSKTCTICGNIKIDLGDAKIYECLNCKNNNDRDLAAARNIYIRSMSRFQEKMHSVRGKLAQKLTSRCKSKCKASTH